MFTLMMVLNKERVVTINDFGGSTIPFYNHDPIPNNEDTISTIFIKNRY